MEEKHLNASNMLAYCSLLESFKQPVAEQRRRPCIFVCSDAFEPITCIQGIQKWRLDVSGNNSPNTVN